MHEVARYTFYYECAVITNHPLSLRKKWTAPLRRETSTGGKFYECYTPSITLTAATYETEQGYLISKERSVWG